MKVAPDEDGKSIGQEYNKKIIYLVRHAEAEHNVRERQALEKAIARGITSKSQQDLARRAVLQRSPSLEDAPLSEEGTRQADATGRKVFKLLDGRKMRYRPPEVVLVSPLRRTLQTAIRCFCGNICPNESNIRFVAIEAMREKRTGLACDERSPLWKLRQEFPYVDFSDLERDDLPNIPKGESNEGVRKRVADFLDNDLPFVQGDFLAIVGHKAWLRELRLLLKSREVENPSRLHLKFDVAEWYMKLFGNAELRVARFEWKNAELFSITSCSLDNAIQFDSGELADSTQDLTLLTETKIEAAATSKALA